MSAVLDQVTESAAQQVVVTAEGEMDMATAGELRGSVGRAMGAPATVVVIDLSAVTFMDCCGLRELVAARARLRAGGRGLRLRSPSPAVLRLLTLTGTSGDFDIVGV